MDRRHPATTAVFALCVLWSLAVLVQIFLAGIGIGELGGKSIDPHKTLGGILHAGTAIILIAALISPSRRRDGPLALGLLVLVTVQITLIDASGAGLRALHPLLGVLALGLAVYLAVVSRPPREARARA